jgi:hypothetical protein
LLKTANTVGEMRGILEEVEAQAKKLRRYDSAVVEGPPKNAERFARDFDGMERSEVEGSNLMVGRELQIASAVGFVKACLDITQNEESLVLGAKAILAGRLALNTLPKVCPLNFETYRRIHNRTFKLYGIAFQKFEQRC